MNTQALRKLVATLAARDTPRSEAQVQADVRQLLLDAPLNLEQRNLEDVVLEAHVGSGFIDIELGACVIEVKRDLRKGNVRAAAIDQLCGYVVQRQEQTGLRYVGVLTDGAEWRCYHAVAAALNEVSVFEVKASKPDVDGLLLWLEGVMATSQGIPPLPEQIHARLGAQSSAHLLDRATLAALYQTSKNKPSVRMKRLLWSRLLRTALGTQFEDSDELFVEHTLLVNSAEIIAHAVLGLPVESISPGSLLSGAHFEEAGVHGVVEQDFFDWVVEVPDGPSFVKTLARRLSRFTWDAVEHDVLKVLYESIIVAATRKKLGEYYTPDWLAEQVVEQAVRNPLAERVLDPACGSGTFLFHAVRLHIAAAEKAGRSLAATLDGVTDAVMGLDLHPVAVALARVTYLLALGRDRITHPERGTIQIPVFLGDSMQWRKKGQDLLNSGELVIEADDAHELPGFAARLRFPDEVLKNSRVFDQLVKELATKAAARTPGSQVPSLKATLARLAIPSTSHDVIKSTFASMCSLHDQGRDHIWGYYVRNLARPVWMARAENRVDCLVGNPPWLAFRHMPAEMQDAFKEMSESRGLWHGKKLATQQDLSALFVARTTQLYLKRGGRFAFVMPSSVLGGGQYEGFRKATFPDPRDRVDLVFDRPWDLRRVRPHFFPTTASVVFGSRASLPASMPETCIRWTGDLRPTSRGWADVEEQLTREEHTPKAHAPEKASPYRDRFTQGAVVVPRVLFFVEKAPSSRLGVPAGSEAVRSTSSATEKRPWRDLPRLEGVVESVFVRPVYLGDSVTPYRARTSSRAVIPYDSNGLMDGTSERLELFPGLAKWWRTAEAVWLKNRSSDRLTLRGQLDYMNKFAAQVPAPLQRVVYPKSGMHLCGARVTDQRAIIDHSLYWASVASDEEALYLCAILNAEVTTTEVRPLMSFSKDERDFHLHVWRLPIPEYDRDIELHRELAELGARAEAAMSEVALPADKGFVWRRQQLRKHLLEGELGQAINDRVKRLMGN